MRPILFLRVSILILTGSVSAIAQDTTNTSAKYVAIKPYGRVEVAGKVVSENDQEVVITSGRDSLTYHKEKIRWMKEVPAKSIHRGKYWFSDPNSCRYIVSSSAVPLKKNTGYVQDFFIILPYINYGITDHISLGIGTTLEDRTFDIVYGNLKFSHQFSEKIYGAAEIIAVGYYLSWKNLSHDQYTISPNVRLMMTYQTEKFHATASLGYGYLHRHYRLYVHSSPDQDTYKASRYPYDSPFASLSARLRLSRKMSLVSENIMLPMDRPYSGYYSQNPEIVHPEFSYYHGLGMNFFGRSLDFGLGVFRLASFEDDLPFFPYIDFTIHFGKL